MKMTLEDIQYLAALGNLVRIAADGAVTVRPLGERSGPLTAAERARRYRHAKRDERHETSRNSDERHETNTPPSPQVSPLHPPSSPTPTPEPLSACATKPEPEKPAKQKDRIAEAKTTTATAKLPPDLDTPTFREAWAEWCAHRETLATDNRDKRWTLRAAAMTLKQCADKGDAWAIVEIRHSIANSSWGLWWDQRRNPADVRSQPMLPNGHANGNGHHPAPPDNRWEKRNTESKS